MGLFQSIFGGSSQKSNSSSTNQSSSNSTSTSNSYNQAYPLLSSMYGGQVGVGTDATSAISSLLGLDGGNPVASSAFKNYLDSTDYNFTLGEGNRNLTAGAAAAGGLGSGATLRAFQALGQNTAQKYYGDYLNRLFNLNQTGLAAGGLISGAGQVSNSNSTSSSQSTGSSTGVNTGSSTPGVAGFIGGLLSAGARG